MSKKVSNYYKRMEANHGSSRQERRGIEAEAIKRARKEIAGLSIPAAKKLVRRAMQQRKQ